MKCPNCGANIETLIGNKSCPHCLYSFSDNTVDKINFYNDLKVNLRGIELTQKSFDTQIENLKNQLNKIESDVYNSQEFESLRVKAQSEIVIPETTIITEVKPKPVKKDSIFDKISHINWEILLGFNGLLILGVISVVTGVAFFIRKAFVSGLLGPVGKVSIIYLGAIVSLGIGNFFRKKQLPEFGAGIIGMGIALLYYSTYSAFENYSLFNQTTTFFLMILITIFAVFISVLENNKWLAVLALIGGFSTPFMIQTGVSNNLVLYTYITILNVGLLGIAFNKKWNILNNLGFIATYLLYLTTFKYTEFALSTTFVNIFFFIYSIVPLAYYIFKSKKENISNSMLIFINSFVALAINYRLIEGNDYPIEYLSIVTILYTLNFALMANYLYKNGRGDEPAFVFTIGKAALFLSITIPVIFSGSAITVFWAAETVVLAWISDRLKNKSILYGAYAILIISVSKFFLYDYSETFNVTEDFYISGGYTYQLVPRLFSSAFLIATYYKFLDLYNKSTFRNNLTFSFFGLGWIASLFIVLNVEVASFFHDYLINLKFVSISVLWAVFAVTLMYFGLKRNFKVIRQISIALFALTLAKVFFFDIAEMSASYKFISFIILGLVLIFASYLYRQFKHQIIGEPENNAEKIDQN